MKRKNAGYLCLIIVSLVWILSGCKTNGFSKKTISESANIQLDNYDGKMSYEIMDTYITSDLKAHKIEKKNFVEDAFVSVSDQNGKEKDIDFPKMIDSNQKLKWGCKLYVIRIKVTNDTGTYKDYKKEEYKSPYIFRADAIHLAYFSDQEKLISDNTSIHYYSLKKKGENTWSTFEVEPGQTKEFEVGFLVGKELFSDKGDKRRVQPSNVYITGDSRTYNKIKWGIK